MLLRPELAQKRPRLTMQGEDHARVVEDYVNCHINIFRLSPSLLLTPRAADGS